MLTEEEYKNYVMRRNAAMSSRDTLFVSPDDPSGRSRYRAYRDSLAAFNLAASLPQGAVQPDGNVHINTRWLDQPVFNRLLNYYSQFPVSSGYKFTYKIKRPTSPVAYRERETLERINPRVPIPPSSFSRTPISIPQAPPALPSYRFTPGFVDPRVAANARQGVADGELLTPEQLEYRRRLRMRQATPMTF